MTSIGVWHVSVEVLIAYRRRRNHAVVLPWRRNGFFVVTARRILALGNGFFTGALRVRRRDSEVGAVADNGEDQCQDEHCAHAEPTHLLSPTVFSLEKPRLGRHGSGLGPSAFPAQIRFPGQFCCYSGEAISPPGGDPFVDEPQA